MNAVVAFALKHRVSDGRAVRDDAHGRPHRVPQLNIEAYPDPTPPMVDVITQSPGALGRGDRALHHHPDRDADRRHQATSPHPHHLAVRPVRTSSCSSRSTTPMKRRCSRCSTGCRNAAAAEQCAAANFAGQPDRRNLSLPAGRSARLQRARSQDAAGLGAAAPLPRGARRRSTSSAGAARPRRSSCRSISTSSSPTG